MFHIDHTYHFVHDLMVSFDNATYLPVDPRTDMTVMREAWEFDLEAQKAVDALRRGEVFNADFERADGTRVELRVTPELREDKDTLHDNVFLFIGNIKFKVTNDDDAETVLKSIAFVND